MRCVILIRVSDEKQREGASLDVQLGDCRRYAAREGWAILEECQDVQSGLDVTRSGYQRVLDLARARTIDVVLIWRLDRFGRDDGEGITRCNELDRLHVRVVSATQGELDPMTRGILFVVAKQESRNTSERVLPAQKRRVEEGLWQTRAPFGYRMDTGRPGILLIHEPEAALVRALFTRAASGESSYSLCGWLNSLTAPDGTKLRSPQGCYFSEPFIKRLLRNPVYSGMIRWNQRRNSKLDGRYAKEAHEHMYRPGQHEAIITTALFEQVQAINATHVSYWRGKPTTRVFLLTGLLRCGVCGRGMYGQWNNYTRAKAQRRALTCFSYKCATRSHAMVSGRWLDSYVLDQLAQLPLDAASIQGVRALLEEESAEQPDRSQALMQARQQQEERRKRLTFYLADGTVTTGDYKVAMAEVETALVLIERELADLAPVQDTAEMIGEAEAWLRTVGALQPVIEVASLEERASLVAGAIQRITFSRESGPVITWQPWAKAVRERLQREPSPSPLPFGYQQTEGGVRDQ